MKICYRYLFAFDGDLQAVLFNESVQRRISSIWTDIAVLLNFRTAQDLYNVM